MAEEAGKSITVELGTYHRKGNWGWRVRVTDPDNDAVREAEVAGRVLAIIGEVFKEMSAARVTPDPLREAARAFVDIWGETEAMESSHAFRALRAAIKEAAHD